MLSDLSLNREISSLHNRKRHSPRIKSILIREYQHKSTRVKTNQHESDTNQHECVTNQHESTRAKRGSTRVQNKSMQVNKSKKVKKSPRQVNASQRKSDMSLT